MLLPSQLTPCCSAIISCWFASFTCATRHDCMSSSTYSMFSCTTHIKLLPKSVGTKSILSLNKSFQKVHVCIFFLHFFLAFCLCINHKNPASIQKHHSKYQKCLRQTGDYNLTKKVHRLMLRY